MNVPDLSIVIPVFNEAAIVRTACEELCGKLDSMGWDYELILAENGSRDDTLGILEGLSRERPRIRYLHEAEANYGRALRRGILEAPARLLVFDAHNLSAAS